jgi:formamidopyrimidine-DNA glycosylase
VPELPEVETVRRGIERRAVGRVVERVEVHRERTVRRQGREAVIDGLTGVRIVAARRRGKYLLCDLDSGGVLMMHLRMTGRVLVVPAGTLPSRNSSARIMSCSAQ